MTDLFDTSQVPDAPEHWDALAERVAGAAHAASTAGFAGFAQSRTGWVAATLVLAAALAFLALPDDDSSPRGLAAEWAQALAPADAVGRAILLRDGPPAIGALLLAGQSEGRP